MFQWSKTRRLQKRTATEIYGAIVAHARDPAFYRDCGVSDTPEGRYELIALMLSLVLERLRETVPFEAQRRLIEVFVTDMDDNMREMGVGDMSVPRKVKRAAAGLMERMEQYRSALANPADVVLRAALETNFPGVSDKPENSLKLARCVRADVQFLSGLPDAAVSEGGIRFPEH